MAKTQFVHITGTGIDFRLRVKEHEIVGLQASTYHKFTLENGVVVYYNDFGVRTVAISATEDDLN